MSKKLTAIMVAIAIVIAAALVVVLASPVHSANATNVTPESSAIVTISASHHGGHGIVLSRHEIIQKRERAKEKAEHRKEVREREQAAAKFERKTREHGHANLSTFQKEVPSGYDSTLLEYHGMILAEPAMEAYYAACLDVGHYIGGAGYRSHSTQAGMTSSLAAPPGYSYHEIGYALDVFGLSGEEEAALLSHGFNPLAGDPGHYSYLVHG